MLVFIKGSKARATVPWGEGGGLQLVLGLLLDLLVVTAGSRGHVLLHKGLEVAKVPLTVVLLHLCEYKN